MQSKTKILILLSIALFFLIVSPVSAANWTLNVDPRVYSAEMDIINSTYMKDWLYTLALNGTTAEFPVIGFAGSLVAPFTTSFENVGAPGEVFYLVMWGLFLVMVWRNSGKVTIPAMLAVITAGAWGLLLPQWAFPWCYLLLAAALASQILTFIARE